MIYPSSEGFRPAQSNFLWKEKSDNSVVKLHQKPGILEFVLKSPLFYLLLLIPTITMIAILGLEEKTPGTNVRILYLHGTWVLTAIVALVATWLIARLWYRVAKE
jgi:hypothetical protein